MKKLLFSSLLFSATMFGQKISYASLSGSVDCRNATFGSQPTGFKPALDGTLAVHAVSNNFEINAGLESFKKIGFRREFFNLGYLSERYIPLGSKEFDFYAMPYAGLSLIHRFDKEDRTVNTPDGSKFIYGNSSHIAFQIGMSFRKNITDNIIVDFTTEFMTRQDLIYMYPGTEKSVVMSNSIGFHYIIAQ